MGVEAGQDLASILRRKELERQAGDGVFVWGIGNSVGPTIREVISNDRTVPVLFSPIQSKPRPVDSKPAALVLWLSYIDDMGIVHPLPDHALVTSRADDVASGSRKRHYALLCRSQRSLLEEDSREVDFGELCNAGTKKGLGFSQVTALVRRIPNNSSYPTLGRRYQVPFQAELFSPYCVRLTDGVAMHAKLADEIASVAQTASPSDWAKFVQCLRSLARQMVKGPIPLFEDVESEDQCPQR
jgi:hypothetical protein